MKNQIFSRTQIMKLRKTSANFTRPDHRCKKKTRGIFITQSSTCYFGGWFAKGDEPLTGIGV